MSDLVPSVSIDNLLQQRDAMVERIREAHRLLMETDELADAMFQTEYRGYRGHRCSLIFSASRREFTGPYGIAEMVAEIDARAWSYLLQKSGLQSFLDADAREKWRKAIDKNDVPELTRPNIEATFTALYQARGEMFERGVIAIFRRLSWDYKTNCPRMFGKRIVMTQMIDVWKGNFTHVGDVSHDGANSLDDLIRVMSVLDGKPEPDHREGAFYKLRALKWPKETKDADLGFFSVRGYKNGNGHLKFIRMDLVDKLNLILAKHHPSALPMSRD